MTYDQVWDEIEFYSNDLKTAAYLYRPKDWNPATRYAQVSQFCMVIPG